MMGHSRCPPIKDPNSKIENRHYGGRSDGRTLALGDRMDVDDQGDVGGASERYKGRWLLLLLEFYVLDAIGELSAEREGAAREMTEKGFGEFEGNDWQGAMREGLRLHESLDEAIRENWRAYQEAVDTPAPEAFAVAFADQYFVPLMDGTAGERGDREENPRQLREAEERKERSHALLRRAGVPINVNLPMIETQSSAKFRTAQEVARRATVLAILAARAEPGGATREQAMGLLKNRGVEDDLTEGEREFLKIEEPTDEQRVQFTWRYEGVFVMLWALGHYTELGPPDHICDVREIIGKIIRSAPEDFVGKAKLRDGSEILDEADLIYRYNWAATDARINGREQPAGIHPGVIYERHYALNWLIGYGGQEWDGVSTDT